MSKVAAGKKQHRSMRGKVVDMDLLRKRNELTPAVGNAKVNARGDELGPGGKIIRNRDEIVQQHYHGAAVDETTVSTTAKASVAVQELLPEEMELFVEDDDWVEDESGNFVKKGE
mgnify:CR=1 FL=1|tara:strand:- start:470 stop:814 length:345 start_codon:yes stop_codon:yes gene_type:complete